MKHFNLSNFFQSFIGSKVLEAKQGYGSFVNLNLENNRTFFIYMTNWKIYLNFLEIANDESKDEEIEKALNHISGQKIKRITLSTDENITELEFENNLKIEMTDKDYKDDVYEMWNFYVEEEKVLIYRNDHKIAFEKMETEFGKSNFKKIEGVFKTS